jgi:dsRNA-specific ribonuclease
MNDDQSIRRSKQPNPLQQQLHLPDFSSYDWIKISLMEKTYINEAYANNHQHKEQLRLHHRRLAHLGDSIMNAAVTDYLFHKFPQADPGTLTKMAQSPKERRKGALLYAKAVGLDRLCKLGNGICERDRAGDMFGEMFEALIGAIYLSSNRDFALTRKWFLTQCAGVIDQQLGENYSTGNA